MTTKKHDWDKLIQGAKEQEKQRKAKGADGTTFKDEGTTAGSRCPPTAPANESSCAICREEDAVYCFECGKMMEDKATREAIAQIRKLWEAAEEEMKETTDENKGMDWEKICKIFERKLKALEELGK